MHSYRYTSESCLRITKKSVLTNRCRNGPSAPPRPARTTKGTSVNPDEHRHDEGWPHCAYSLSHPCGLLKLWQVRARIDPTLVRCALISAHSNLTGSYRQSMTSWSS